MARYRIRTTDGQFFEVEGKAAITRHHPGAIITHTIVFDALGQGSTVPYFGKQDASDDDAAPQSDETANVAVEVTAPADDAPVPQKRTRRDR